MRYYLISDNIDTKTGLRLVGIDGTYASTEQEFSAALDKVLADNSIGILLVTEKLSTMCEDILFDIKTNRKTPLLTIIPDSNGTGREKDSITKYVTEAIGIKI